MRSKQPKAGQTRAKSVIQDEGAESAPAGARWKIWLGPLVALGLFFGPELETGKPQLNQAAAVAAWMALWWITEAVPLWLTALLPLVLFPLLGLQKGSEVAGRYMSQTTFLFLGGFLMAGAMERWGLHRRVAYHVLLRAPATPTGVLLGFIAATAMVSAWVSNTSTAMIMVPIVLAVIKQLEHQGHHIPGLDKALLLGVGYAATTGGMASLVGTPPNITMARNVQALGEAGANFTFARYLLFGVPVALGLSLLVWAVLHFRYKLGAKHAPLDHGLFRKQLASLGSASKEERWVFSAFVVLVSLWCLREDLPLGGFTLKGWSSLFPDPKAIEDGSVAIMIAALLFLIPARDKQRVLDTRAIEALPWGILLLFGGGLALAKGMESSGLAAYISGHASALAGLPAPVFLLTLTLFITALSEFTSNTATAEMLLPVLAASAVSMGQDPLALLVPAGLACSLGFMMPAGTPPNAIVFATGRLKMKDMLLSGLWLNVLSALFLTLASLYLLPVVFK